MKISTGGNSIAQRVLFGCGSLLIAAALVLLLRSSSDVLGAYHAIHLKHWDSVTYGNILTDCPSNGQRRVALTFDDGPSNNTDLIVEQLAKYGAQATFFMNKPVEDDGGIVNQPESERMKRIYAAGHQIASHTWKHLNLSETAPASIADEMLRTEEWFQQVVGFRPRYMRPPYGDCDDSCRGVMRDMGYHVVNWNVDTEDWKYREDTNASFHQAVIQERDVWEADYGVIVLMHDWQPTTATTLLPALLEYFAAREYTFVTVGDCFDAREENWYRFD